MQAPADPVIRIDGTRAERALLASLILGDGEARAECERLDPETLQGEVERRILRAAQTVLRRGDALTNVAVAEELDRMPAGRGMTEAQAEMRLTDFVAEWGFDAPPAADCAAIIAREHLRRRAVRDLSAAVVRLNAGADPREVQGTVADVAVALGEQRAEQAVLVRDVVHDRFSEYEAMWEGNAPRGVSTGFPKLDELTAPWEPEELVIVFADGTSMGKSSFALQVAHHEATHGGRVLLCSIEMSRRAVIDRLMTQHGGLDLKRMRRRQVDGSVWADLTRALGILSEGEFWLDCGCRTTADVAASARRLQLRQGPVSLLVVDHLHHLSDSQGGRQSEESRWADMTQRCKDIAKDIGCPMLLVAQPHRREGGDDKRAPRLSDLHGSGRIEKIADQVLAIHPTDTEQLVWPVEMYVLKSRSYWTGKVPMRFRRNRARFEEASDRTEPAARRGDDPSER